MKNENSKVKKTQDEETEKKIKSFLIILSPILFIIIIITSLSNTQWHEMIIKTELNNMTNDGMKETIKKVFSIEGDTYIEKIKYKSGFDDGHIYGLCVYTKKGKRCKTSDSPL